VAFVEFVSFYETMPHAIFNFEEINKNCIKYQYCKTGKRIEALMGA